MSNHSKRNALHLAALHGSIEAMDMLAASKITGLDATSRDTDGHTPNECFLKCRSAHCAVARMPFDMERTSFTRLLKSIAGEIEVPFAVLDEDGYRVVMPEAVHDNRSESDLFSEISSDNMSDDEYVDAEDSF